VPALHRLLTADGHAVPAEAPEARVRDAFALGPLFRDGATFVALPTCGEPVRLPEGAR
jgi:hypothetical protein